MKHICSDFEGFDKFEAWARSHGFDLTVVNGSYADNEAESALAGWNARQTEVDDTLRKRAEKARDMLKEILGEDMTTDDYGACRDVYDLLCIALEVQ